MSVDLVKKLLKPFTAQFGMGEEEDDEVVASSEEAVSPQVEEPAAEASVAEAPAAEEAPMPAKSGPIDQATADALLASLLAEQNGEGSSEAAPAPAAEPAPAPEPVAAAPAPVAEPAAPAPQPAAAPQPAPAQMAPQMMAMPQGVAYQDPLTLQLLNQMQQSQTQMLELIRDIQTAEEIKTLDLPSRRLIKPLIPEEFENEGGSGGENPDNREMLMKVPLESFRRNRKDQKAGKGYLRLYPGFSGGSGQDGRRAGRPLCKRRVHCSRRHRSCRRKLRYSYHRDFEERH